MPQNIPGGSGKGNPASQILGIDTVFSPYVKIAQGVREESKDKMKLSENLLSFIETYPKKYSLIT